jgi:hypothetical protein
MVVIGSFLARMAKEEEEEEREKELDTGFPFFGVDKTLG